MLSAALVPFVNKNTLFLLLSDSKQTEDFHLLLQELLLKLDVHSAIYQREVSMQNNFSVDTAARSISSTAF